MCSAVQFGCPDAPLRHPCSRFRFAVPSPLDDLAAAREALAKGRYAEAASLAERATAAHPLLVEGYIVEGRALANQGDDDGAIAALRKAVFLDPRAAHAHFLLGHDLVSGRVTQRGQRCRSPRRPRPCLTHLLRRLRSCLMAARSQIW